MRTLNTLLVTILLTAGAAQADNLLTIPGVTTTGNVAMTSNYKFRGEDQSGKSPAVQGGLTFTHESGVYLSTWGSSINFGGSSEIDVMLGYGTQVSGGSVDVGVMRYVYPDSTMAAGGTELDFNELYASYGVGDVKLSAAYSPDYYNEQGNYYRVGASYGTKLGPVGVQLAAGYNDLADQNQGSYVDYKAAVTGAINGVDAELAYVGGAGDWVDAAEAGGSNAFDGETVFTLSKTF